MSKELYCFDCKRPANTGCKEQKHRMNTEEVGAVSESKEQQHTPTPWEVQAGDDYFITAAGYPKDAPAVVDSNLDDDVLVALVGNQTKDCGEANARFMCRAVNSHEALVEALQFALRESGCDGDLCNYRWHEKARAALALAEKEI